MLVLYNNIFLLATRGPPSFTHPDKHHINENTKNQNNTMSHIRTEVKN